MQLIDFISGHHDAIAGEWESFARTLLPGAEGMSGAGLRDHARAILTAIARDMESRQSPDQEEAKSKGEKTAGHLGALGELHAVLRIESGFSLTQVVAEYRALRASVFRLWGTSHSDDPEGVLRFNEAIDEALSEAVTRYAEKMNQYRDEVTAIVSHDLLDPLNAILLDSAVLFESGGLDDRTTETVTRIQNSAKRMNRIVRDLLDLTRIRLGLGLPIVRKPTDAGPICTMVITEFEATPGSWGGDGPWVGAVHRESGGGGPRGAGRSHVHGSRRHHVHPAATASASYPPETQ
jgi:signal transduction histidine kinase